MTVIYVYMCTNTAYSEITPYLFTSPGAGSVVPNKYIITLRNDTSLESFKNFLNSHGIEASKLTIIHGFAVTIPENRTIGELKEILAPDVNITSLTGKENTRITSVINGCTLLKNNPDIETCEPVRRGGVS